MIEIKVQCAVITKYYFRPKQIAFHLFRAGKAAIDTQQTWVLDNGLRDLYIYVLNLSKYTCKVIRW